MARSPKKARRQPKRHPQGRLSVTRGGFGFVDTPEGEYFVPESKMRGAFDGDLVQVAPTSINPDRPQPGKLHNQTGRKPTARIVQVVERARTTLVGRYEVAEPFGVVIPEDDRIRHDVFTMHAEHPELKDGDLVKVRITHFPGPGEAATGEVVQVVGHAGDSDLGINAIIADHNLRTEFPEDVCIAAERVVVDAQAALESGYVDLRERCVFTIDPVDARDFDDALSLDTVDDGAAAWRLGVHIADVSHYVAAGAPLDREARLRGTSVYLADRVIPMLPEALSNDACSLRPHEDRLSMTVDIFLDAKGVVQSFDCYQAVIRSQARLDYAQVQAFLDGEAGTGAAARAGADEAAGADEMPTAAERAAAIPEHLHERLIQLNRLGHALVRQRQHAGALDLDSAEAHVILDTDGKPVDVAVRRTTEATSLVEQAMILANACVATRLENAQWPCLYRVHEAPSPDSLARLVPIVQEYGLDRGVDLELFQAGEPKALQQVLSAAREADAGQLVSMLLLRALKRACYEPSCKGHFGLALERYAHFTSPIRRYPDLVVHRMLAALLHGDTNAAERARTQLQDMADASSAAERAADAAARESQELKLTEYLQNFEGEIFPGTIVRVASYGFFVELENTAVGMVPLGDAGNDIFALDVERQTLVGRETGTVFRLGQHVLVRLVGAYPEERKIDFSLVSRSARGRGIR